MQASPSPVHATHNSARCVLLPSVYPERRMIRRSSGHSGVATDPAWAENKHAAGGRLRNTPPAVARRRERDVGPWMRLLAFLPVGVVAVRGRVGNCVFKTYGSRVIVTRVPRFDGYVPSESQRAQRDRLRAATVYAQRVYADPAAKALYVAAARRLGRQPFRLAISDFLSRGDAGAKQRVRLVLAADGRGDCPASSRNHADDRPRMRRKEPDFGDVRRNFPARTTAYPSVRPSDTWFPCVFMRVNSRGTAWFRDWASRKPNGPPMTARIQAQPLAARTGMRIGRLGQDARQRGGFSAGKLTVPDGCANVAEAPYRWIGENFPIWVRRRRSVHTSRACSSDQGVDPWPDPVGSLLANALPVMHTIVRRVCPVSGH